MTEIFLRLAACTAITAVAAAAAATGPPELPSQFASLSGVGGGGFHRVIGDRASCPARLELTSEWTVALPGEEVPFIREATAVVQLVAPATTGEIAGRCGFVSLHMLPDIEQAMEGGVEAVRDQAVVGKVFWSSPDPRCVSDRSPPQTRLTVMTRSLVDSVRSEIVGMVNVTQLKGMFGESAERMMFYRNAEVTGKLKNCAYVDGSGEPVEETAGIDKLFVRKDGAKMRPAMEMFVQTLLFGEDGNKTIDEGPDRHVGSNGQNGKRKGKKHPEMSSEDMNGPQSAMDHTDPGLMALSQNGPGDIPRGAEADTSHSITREDKAETSNCFPAEATVLLASGETKRMDELAVGDRISVGRGEFSAVFMFTHKLPAARANFVTLSTASGEAITLTPGHYLQTAAGGLVAAGAVCVGDDLVLANGAPSHVLSARATPGVGLFNPQTATGNMVVDGVLVSAYTTAIDPSLAHAVLSPLRAMYNVFGVSTSVLDGGANAVAKRLPQGVRRLYEFASLVFDARPRLAHRSPVGRFTSCPMFTSLLNRKSHDR
jgi:Hint module